MRIHSSDSGILLSAIAIAIWLFTAGTYVGNIVQLTKCDWSNDGSWKGEIVHVIGLIPPCSVVTVWNKDR
jgi:hypothetical protein